MSQKEHSPANREIPIRITVDNISDIEGILYSEVFDTLRFVQLETTDESLVGRIDKLVCYKNHYYVLDQIQSKAVLVFDENGTFIRRIGKNGNGPGEYDEPNDIAIDPFSDKIYVYVNNRKCLLGFDLNGNFIEEIKLDYWIKSFSLVEENVFALYFDYTKNPDISNENDYDLLLINNEGEILNRFFYLDESRDFGQRSLSFFHQSSHGLLVSPGYNDTLYQVGLESVTPNYIIDFGNYGIPVQLLYNKSHMDFDRELRDQDYAFLSSFFDTPDYLFFSFVSQGKIHSAFYSKISGNLKYTNILVNDICGMMEGPFTTITENSELIAYFQPTSIDAKKMIYSTSSTDGTRLKEELLSYYESVAANFSGKIRDDLLMSMKTIEKATFSPTQEEINLVNSIHPEDNPVLIICKLKEF